MAIIRVKTYTPFNKTATITEGDYELTYTYGPDNQRIKSILKNQGATVRTIIYEGNYEKITDGANTYEVHYIAGGSGLTAINVRTNGGGDEMFYVYTDHLGSILTLTDATGNIIYETNFDAWGRERNPNDWTYTANPTTPPVWLIRGFTGHEHLKEFALINMNGRVYDPLLGRVNSPDNFVQNPYFSQSFNRYSYALNNPLIYTDPTGNDFQEFDDQPRYYPKWWETILDFFGYSLGHYTGYISSQDGGTDAFDSNPPGYSELSSDYEISEFYSTDDQGAQGGGGEGAPTSAFTQRGNDVNYKTLLNEFVTGTGSEYSLFTEGHPMVDDLKKSWIVTVAAIKFLSGGGKPIYDYNVPFGLVGAGLSYSMTEQFIGGARVSIIPTSAGNLFIMNNTTGVYSGSYHQMNDIHRVPGTVTPYGNIYQRFIWFQK